MVFEFKDPTRCTSCRHVISSVLYKDVHRITCAFREEQIGHARVPKWCPKYAYLHDGVKEETNGKDR